MKPINIYHPTNVILLAIMGYIFFPFIYYATIGGEYFPVKFSFLDEAIWIPFLSHLLSILFLVIFPVNKNVTTVDVDLVRERIKIKNLNFLFFVTIAFLFLSVFLFWYVNYTYGFTSQASIMENIISYRLAVERDSAGMLVLRNAITTVMIFSISATWYFYKLSSSSRVKVLFFLSISILGYISLLSGRRLDLVSLILLASLFMNFRGAFDSRRRIGVSLISIVVLFFFFFFIVSWYSFFRKGMILENGSAFIYEFVRRFDGVYPNFGYLYNNQHVGNNFFYGITYVRALLNFIPRAIFPEKHANLQMYFNDNLKLYDDSGMDFGNFGEVWVNFGPACILFTTLYFFVLRRFVCVVYLHFINLRFTGVSLYCYLIYGFLHFVSSPIDSTNIMFFFMNFVFIYLLSLLITAKCITYEKTNES